MESVFFWLSKLVWLFISPDSFLLIWFALSLFLMWRGKLRWAKRLLSSLAIILLIIGLFPVGEWLLYPLEKQYPTNPKLGKVDGIILLGGAEDPVRSYQWKQPIVGNAAERDFAFIQLAKKYPNAKKIFTGGSSSMAAQTYKGADTAKQLFTQQGLDVSSIIFERNSRNTWENAIFSKKLADIKKGENWVLITTGWHMPRSAGIFCKAEWDIIPYPVDFWTQKGNLLRVDWNFSGHLKNLVVAVREWVGITAYQLTGKMC